MEINKILMDIADNWFKYESFVFNVFCTHKLEENNDLPIMFRTGNGKIEYNSELIKKESVKSVERRLLTEIYRIILKHPYQRLPINPKRSALGLSSDMTIRDICPSFVHLAKPEDFGINPGLCFEEYYDKIKAICPEEPQLLLMALTMEEDTENIKKSGKSGKSDESENKGKSSESPDSQYLKATCSSELWGEDGIMVDKINKEIEKAEKTNLWGSISGNLKEEIIASKDIPMNYNKILAQFRANIISDKRKLTRMKPNRRYGFPYMGSNFKPKTNLLVACDVSGSISTIDLQNFLSIINRFFKYGVEKITVLTFDVEINNIDVIDKTQKKITITGQGGTDFQDVIDFYEKNEQFNGLIIFTDGYAGVPVIHKNKPIMWILSGLDEYNDAIPWIRKLRNSKATWIPHTRG